MPEVFAIILGIVQGLTEFLPISSSGHLVVMQEFLAPVFAASETPLAFDVLLHVATLLVTVWFLRDELLVLFVSLARGGEQRERAIRLGALVIVATLPAVLVVLLAKDMIEQAFSSTDAVTFGFLITSIFLFESGLRKRRDAGALLSEGCDWELPSFTQALCIGIAQAVAIFPGVSRSGSTIAMALILGARAETAVRFSFYLLLPAVGGAFLLEAKNLATAATSDYLAYVLGFGSAVVVGWFSLLFLVKVVKDAKLHYFAVYTLTLALALLVSR